MRFGLTPACRPTLYRETLVLRRFILTTAALGAAVVAYALVTLPPARIVLGAPVPANVVLGAYHVHTIRSDGSADPEAVAAAASRAGLAFVIFTDHGDATRIPDPPRYVNGVLVIDAVEVSTAEGHVVAMGLNGAAPYRLAGEARDVIDDIHRLGGFAIVAHPDSPRAELGWRSARSGTDLDGADGIEWINADSEWRADAWPDLARALLHIPIRPAESLAGLLTRPAATLRRWDAMTRRRAAVGLGAVDAHGLAGGFYTAMFRSLAQGAILDAAFSGQPAEDAARLLEAIRLGHAFTIVSGIGSPAAPTLTVHDNTRTVSMGGRLDAPDGVVGLEGAVDGAPAARVVILHNGREVASGRRRAEVPAIIEPGAYRMEAWLGDAPIPWIVTNPVYVGGPVSAPRSTGASQPGARASDEPARVPLGPGPEWAIEHGPSSSGAIDVAGDVMNFRYTVGTRYPMVEFAALSRSMGEGVESFDRIEFVASADAPARLSVQFRLPGGRGEDERWARSVYLDRTPRPISVLMTDVVPVGFSATRRPVVARIRSILFVLDTLNSVPGTRGVVRLSGVRLGHPAQPEPSRADGQEQVQRPGQEQEIRRPRREGGRQ